MNDLASGKTWPKCQTQNRIVALFTPPEADGGSDCRNLGDWHQRPIEPELLRTNLRDHDYFGANITSVLQQLKTTPPLEVLKQQLLTRWVRPG